ncbi:MAG: translocation/assembly module TamB, partial [Chitinophagaceae bacterium]
MDQEKLELTEEGIKFNRFEVKDSAGNSLTLNGTVATKDYTSYKFDLDVRANNFRALNSTKRDNKLFYGQLYFNTNLKITGTELAPKIDGRLAINDKTKMTIVLPQPDPGVVNREGVIEFFDMDAPVNDSLFLLPYDSLNTSSFTGMDISLNIQVDKAADFSLIIDEANGDLLNIKGEADLNAGVDPSGKINMTGVYEVDQGSYQLSFNMLKRKFDIQKGSKITWEGEPTDANVELTAIYTTKAAPYDLVKGLLTDDEKNLYLQRIPFDVLLKMEGALLKPQISFDITLPENRNYGVQGNVITLTRTQLESLRQQPGDMNKQVFSLLLLNRFVPDNPFSLASGSGGGSNSLIRQSVSALMADQLNRLAEGLIEGVDINFGIESSDDYTSGQRQNRTD